MYTCWIFCVFDPHFVGAVDLALEECRVGRLLSVVELVHEARAPRVRRLLQLARDPHSRGERRRVVADEVPECWQREKLILGAS